MTSAKERKKKVAAQELIGLASVEDFFLSTTGGELIAFLMTDPSNLSVLPSDVILGRVQSLRDAINEIGRAEILCMNSSQNYESNKKHLEALAAKERNETLRQLDLMDNNFLDEIRTKTATNREFLIVLRFTRRNDKEQISRAMIRVRNILKERGFQVRVAEKEDIQRLLAIYYEQNVFTETLQDFDGKIYMEQ